jgi:hypothetical protein
LFLAHAGLDLLDIILAELGAVFGDYSAACAKWERCSQAQRDASRSHGADPSVPIHKPE